jgi:hypothetical protein
MNSCILESKLLFLISIALTPRVAIGDTLQSFMSLKATSNLFPLAVQKKQHF